jgi:hypothetical protein
VTFYVYVNDVNVTMGRFLFKASFHEPPYHIPAETLRLK